MIGIMLVAFSAFGEIGSGPRPYDNAQSAVLKIYGAGSGGLEGYQTGVLVDSEGLVLTADSVALDGGPVVLVDVFGDRYEALLLARDAETGLALLKCLSEPNATAVPLETPTPQSLGTRVWVLSNAFNIAAGAEPSTVQNARIAAVASIPLPADERPRPGIPAHGQTVVMLDAATSNPGAAGGLVVDNSGRVVGVLGAECRSPLTGSWINYAIPAEAVVGAIKRMQTGSTNTPTGEREVGRPWRAVLWERGLSFVPTLDERTPPYIELVAPASEAAVAGLRADDLVVAINGTSVSEVESAGSLLAETATSEGVRVTVLRGEQINVLTLERGEAP